MSTFLTPRLKDEVRHLQHHREAEFVGGAGQVVGAADDDGRRHGDAVPRHQLVQVDLVGAANHRDRIVDDRHPLLHGAAGEAVGVVVDRGRLADEQGVEFRQPREIATGDRLDLDALLLGDTRQVLEGRQVRRRHGVVGIVENGEGIARRGAVLLRAPLAAGVVVERAMEEGEFDRRELGDRDRGEAPDLGTVAVLDRHLEHRAAEPVEQQPAEAVEAAVLDGAEIDQQPGRNGLVRGGGERLYQRILELGQGLGVERAGAEIDHGLDRGDDAMAARLGEQRAVVAPALVVERAGEVDDLRPAAAEQAGARQVVPGGDDLVGRVRVRKILGGIHQNDPVGHGQSSMRGEGPRAGAARRFS